MALNVCLALIETSGNQNYIFSTNKLRENVGASELTYRAGTQWVLEAVAAKHGPSLWTEDGPEMRRRLVREQTPIEEAGAVIEVLVATSGKALLLVKDRDVACAVVRAVTLRALKEAPGLDVCGVVSQPFDWCSTPLGEQNGKLHVQFEQVRSGRPGIDLRFLRLPVVADCATSGLPAAEVDKNGPEPNPQLRSAVSAAKRCGTTKALDRIKRLVHHHDPSARSEYRLARHLDHLDDLAEGWLAVVHSDGNGLGEIFLQFGRHAGCTTPDKNRDYVDKLRRFSAALETCTEKAFVMAMTALPQVAEGKERRVVPLVPLVLGGDDLTAVCDGQYALAFTRRFLEEFEKETASTAHEGGIVPEIAMAALGDGRLSACAGVAIVKPHFPFSGAYVLAESLITSSKQVKRRVKKPGCNTPWPCSAIDFHVLYDSSGTELDRIRRKLVVPGPHGPPPAGPDADSVQPAQDGPAPAPRTPLPSSSAGADADGPGSPPSASPEPQGAPAAAEAPGKPAQPGGSSVARSGQQPGPQALLIARPYIVTPEADLAGTQEPDWQKWRRWERLEARVKALQATDRNGRRCLPNSQMHDLRAGLFLGKNEADGRYGLIRHWYKCGGIETLANPDDTASLFWMEPQGGGKPDRFITGLLDAMDAADFFKMGTQS